MFALRFLLHCIQDLRQPCHVGDNKDKGGSETQVRCNYRSTHCAAILRERVLSPVLLLHFLPSREHRERYWDSGIIERAGDNEDFWLADLDTPDNRAAWMGGTVEDWATESLLAAREAYLIPGTDKRLKSGQKLGEEYQAKHLPVARQRLCQAAFRLAMVLNEAFSEK